MLSFVDVSGFSMESFYLLSTSGAPGEWSGIFRYDRGVWSLLREFSNEWLVSIDVFGENGLVAVSDEGMFYQYFEGVWDELDCSTIHGLTNVRSFGCYDSYISGSNGYFAHIQQKSVDKIQVGSRHRIMSIYGENESSMILVGDKGLFIRVVNGQIFRDEIANKMLCDVVENSHANITAVGSKGLIVNKNSDGVWSKIDSGVSWPLTEICMFGDDVLYCVGGGILKLEGGVPKIEVDYDDSTTFLCAIEQFKDGYPIAVGERETILVGPNWQELGFSL